MNEVGWAAAALNSVVAVLALIRSQMNAYNARRLAESKAESDRKALLDRMEHETQFQILKQETAVCAADRTRLDAATRECQDQHKKSEIQLAEMRAELKVLKSLFGPKPTVQQSHYNPTPQADLP
jgi:septal ring factor EnvC (AmiA/AmiB activator)